MEMRLVKSLLVKRENQNERRKKIDFIYTWVYEVVLLLLVNGGHSTM